jgi:UDP-2,3-diacylglucosamine hydrolase
MRPSYFISDIHLGMKNNKETEEAREKLFVSFLKKIEQESENLFIVGDLFDFWFEYKHAIPRGHHRTLAQLSNLVESGVNVYYILGNHDYWTDGFLEKEVGVKVFYEPLEFKISDKKFFLCHGDGIAKRDVGYRMLKKIFRNKFNITLYKFLHPDIGIPFAKVVSGTSRHYNQIREFHGWDEDYLNSAKQKFLEGFDYVVMGHRHKPKIIEVDKKFYVDLGDWIYNYTYGKFDGEKFYIEKIDINNSLISK